MGTAVVSMSGNEEIIFTEHPTSHGRNIPESEASLGKRLGLPFGREPTNHDIHPHAFSAGKHSESSGNT